MATPKDVTREPSYRTMLFHRFHSKGHEQKAHTADLRFFPDKKRQARYIHRGTDIF